ncbi:Ku protein [Bradyrhizobium sp. LHD-71]|uniref:non-homologous end joining protein Ku n=1 Tax=Bradyrhizobium sp. LHD-71 TaxID=3072141 RepID=UPI00280F12FD|nr:Ku protein [Bradyrhizobium sp. LHD-71]MDQ8727285.1 Ku protein [Bradyrhizobium sp. LHD-71]
MAPRANWKGYLRLSLVTCPVALFPATSESEKVSFNQINKRTGNRIKYQRVDAETGEDVDNEDIIKGYKVDADTYIEVTKDELDNIALESNHTIDIDQFVPRDEIDDLYVVRPYYLVPDGKVGHDAYAVIRDTVKATDKVALARVVLTNREHVIALEARDKGLVGLLLRYPYEVRQSGEYFDGIQDVKITKDMLDLAKHIVDQKSGHFEPDNFEDHYEAALIDLINQKRAGRPVAKAKVKTEGNVINLMDALRQSLKGQTATASEAARQPPPAKKAGKAKKRVEGQREMLFALEGKGQKASAKAETKREAGKRPARATTRQKRAG